MVRTATGKLKLTLCKQRPRATRANSLQLSCGHFVGQDPKIAEILDLAMQVAATDATILITGECGTGKELVAKAIHEMSDRANAPLTTVNCGAIPENLGESDLFGHVQGAFTGATYHKIGRFEAANNGTILLDEVSEASLALQVKLLRILQSGEYTPVGTTETRSCDVRVIAATNRDLEQLSASGEFRSDLYYRLNIIRLHLPPLRERRGDIALLADYFLRRFRTEYHKPNLQFSNQAVDYLVSYRFPGNVRELENIVRRCTILCRDSQISVSQLPPEVCRNRPSQGDAQIASFHSAKQQAVERFERIFLVKALTASGGIVSRAAGSAGLSERNFHAKLKKYGIASQRFRDSVRTGLREAK